MEVTSEEFYHDFKQRLMAGAEANSSFILSEFMETVANELIDTGIVEGYDFCHYRAKRGMRVDGYCFSDEDVLDLFIADFDNRTELASLTQTEITAIFKRLTNFFSSSIKQLFIDLEETSPEYGLARQIYDRRNSIRRVNFFLISERALSERFQSAEFSSIKGIPSEYQIWDILRLQRQQSSRGFKEALDLNFLEMFGESIPCLRAHLHSDEYPSYLAVISGHMLSALYDKYGARLLEQNVRSFLQARGKINRGIRSTILNEPEMFFAYNNGLTVTAQEVETQSTEYGLQITRIKDLQIVNGGQTTASLFHTKRKDKATLERIFVQMKLSVVTEEDDDEIVPRISEYANTQNRVNAADFFSNHPYHLRIQDFSRRKWAPAKKGEQRETKWFYERARGQYADAQSKLTKAGIKRFQAEYPFKQKFTKTDLAKFENVWDEHPKWVNLGAQKNFVQYAKRIGKEWDKSPNKFNEYYYRKIVVRALLFRATEKVVSSQSWYQGGYRANIVAYTLAILAHLIQKQRKSFDSTKLWTEQTVSQIIQESLAKIAKTVHDVIIRTSESEGVSNVSEWCKRDGCWEYIKAGSNHLGEVISNELSQYLVDESIVEEEEEAATKIQKTDNGIEAQTVIVKVPGDQWKLLLDQSKMIRLTDKEKGILNIATQIPKKIPTPKQCEILLRLLTRAEEEGIRLD